MAEDRRVAFVRKWFQRAVEADDPFDAFFSGWIALIVAAHRPRTRFETRSGDRDSDRVRKYFRASSHSVCNALRGKQDVMVLLAQRRGTSYGNPILDTGSHELHSTFSRLADHYRGGLPLPDKELAEHVAELLNKVRNNLFHGEKMYDDRGDIALLELVNPLLIDILRNCENL